MKRRILMGIFSIVAVFAVENLTDELISEYVPMDTELIVWAFIAVIAGLIVHELGEDRGDW